MELDQTVVNNFRTELVQLMLDYSKQIGSSEAMLAVLASTAGQVIALNMENRQAALGLMLVNLSGGYLEGLAEEHSTTDKAYVSASNRSPQ